MRVLQLFGAIATLSSTALAVSSLLTADQYADLLRPVVAQDKGLLWIRPVTTDDAASFIAHLASQGQTDVHQLGDFVVRDPNGTPTAQQPIVRYAGEDGNGDDQAFWFRVSAAFASVQSGTVNVLSDKDVSDIWGDDVDDAYFECERAVLILNNSWGVAMQTKVTPGQQDYNGPTQSDVQRVGPFSWPSECSDFF